MEPWRLFQEPGGGSQWSHGGSSWSRGKVHNGAMEALPGAGWSRGWSLGRLVADSHNVDEDLDPDQHQSKKLGPDSDPHRNEKLDPDPDPHSHKSEKQILIKIAAPLKTGRTNTTYYKGLLDAQDHPLRAASAHPPLQEEVHHLAGGDPA